MAANEKHNTPMEDHCGGGSDRRLLVNLLGAELDDRTATRAAASLARQFDLTPEQTEIAKMIVFGEISRCWEPDSEREVKTRRSEIAELRSDVATLTAAWNSAMCRALTKLNEVQRAVGVSLWAREPGTIEARLAALEKLAGLRGDEVAS